MAAVTLTAGALFATTVAAQQVRPDARRFYPDDPLWRDSDDLDIPSVEEFELLKDYDFVENSFGDPAVPVPGSAWGPEDDVRDRYAVARIETVHPDFPRWREPVVVSLRERNGEVEVVGIERPGPPLSRER